MSNPMEKPMKKDAIEIAQAKIPALRELARKLAAEDAEKKARRDANWTAKDSFITERMRREAESRNKGLPPDTLL